MRSESPCRRMPKRSLEPTEKLGELTNNYCSLTLTHANRRLWHRSYSMVRPIELGPLIPNVGLAERWALFDAPHFGARFFDAPMPRVNAPIPRLDSVRLDSTRFDSDHSGTCFKARFHFGARSFDAPMPRVKTPIPRLDSVRLDSTCFDSDHPSTSSRLAFETPRFFDPSMISPQCSLLRCSHTSFRCFHASALPCSLLGGFHISLQCFHASVRYLLRSELRS